MGWKTGLSFTYESSVRTTTNGGHGSEVVRVVAIVDVLLQRSTFLGDDTEDDNAAKQEDEECFGCHVEGSRSIRR
jgi:hypothetical protein